MSLPSLSIRRPVTTLMFFVGVVLLGIIAFQNLAVDFLPSIKIPKLTIQTSYPNVSAEEIENTLTQPIEAALGTVTGTKKVSSVSREGLSVVTAEFYWGTNMDFAMLEVREKLDQLRTALPREASRPTILRIDPATEPVLTVAVSERYRKVNLTVGGEGAGGLRVRGDEERAHLVELKETARALIKRRIEQVSGVAQASVLGGLEREIQVEIDTRRSSSLGVTLDQVSSALASANLNLPGGTIKQGLFRYSLRTVGEFTTVDEIRRVVVTRTPAGRAVTIADLGTVLDGFKERIGITRYNGREIIALHVRKEAGSNTVEVSQRIHAVLDRLRSEYPALALDVISDQAEFISKSITDVEQAIVIGALLAFLVLFFFLRRLRFPVIIGLTMPISILATFIAMYFLHINLNIISLTGLALGIGMLGDNAIIVIENVTRLREKGMGVVEAALEGAQEINLAVTASTLTNVAIFLPIIFVEGVAQQLFVDMGVTMTISLLVSLLVAATLVPMLVGREIVFVSRSVSLSEHLEHQRKKERGIAGTIWFWSTLPVRFLLLLLLLVITRSVSLAGSIAERLAPAFYKTVDQVSAAAYEAIGRFLEWSLKHRVAVLVVTLGLFAASVAIAFLIPSEPAPDIDQSRFVVQVEMPRGSTLEGTSLLVRTMEADLLALDGVKSVYSTVGMPEDRTIQTILDASIERAVLEIKVDAGTNTPEMIAKVRSHLATIRHSYAGVEFSVKRRGTTFEQILRPEPNDLKVRIAGRDPLVAGTVAAQFTERLRDIEGLVDLRTSLQRGNPEYQIEVDREQASRYGLSVQAIAQHVGQYVRGKEATYLSDFDRKITIRVRASEEQRETMNDVLLSSMQVGGKGVPVRELIRWRRMEGQGEIWRENQQRAVVLVANVSGRSIGSVADDIQQQIHAASLPVGYSISIGGENEEIRESFRSLLIIILLSIFLVYMILAAEYESILYPFVIILTSPLAFIGAIGAMAITGQNYNVMSLIGLVIMIGAVDNDAVIAVDIITALRREGMDLTAAVKEGIRRRLRPIIMTTATTVLGIVPLVFEFGTGSELVQALTIPLVGGLIASTFFTLVAIPVVYTYIDRWAIGRNRPRIDANGKDR
ncbi:MAG TPA: hypothetical protein DCP63_11245 [Bacteroidetes bacterium]|nr:hypothetical protein [Bacteroidota bacterium]